MGYFAKADGSAKIKEGVNQKQLEQLLLDVREETETKIDFDIFDGSIVLWDSDSHWDEEYTLGFLNTLNPYITEGCMVYTGENNSIWRYKYNPEKGNWEEEFSSVDFSFESYSDDDLISELTKRGYTVTKDTK